MKKEAIICDIDGVLLSGSEAVEELNRYIINKEFTSKEFEEEVYKKWYSELPNFKKNKWCYYILHNLPALVEIIFLTARNEKAREVTNTFLKEFKHYELFMRGKLDRRKDSELKEEILVTSILPNYNILFALDDNIENCRMYKKHGIDTVGINLNF